MSFWTGTNWETEGPVSAPRGRPSRRRHILEAVAEGTLVGLIAVGLVAGSAFAAKGGNKPGPAPSGGGSCTVTPDPVAVGGMYTFWGSGFAPDQLLGVLVSDSHGTQAFSLQADANGDASVSSYASWSGTDNVNVYDNGVHHGHKRVLLASCSFTVQ